jgi:hypothetical protein
MKLNDIENLSRDPNQGDLYDLFNKTYIDYPLAQSNEYVVDQDEEMRMDLISFRLYGSVDYVDFLCNLNQIDNPLNIMAGDTIKYVDISQTSLFIYEDVKVEEVRRGLLNANKSTRKDPNRKQFVDQGYSLPPNFLETPQAPVRFEGNILVIGS